MRAVQLDAHAMTGELEQVGVCDREHCAWVVQRGQIGVHELEDAGSVMAQQGAREFAERRCRSVEAIQERVVDADLMRQIEPAQSNPGPAPEHHVGGFRVGPDVELRRRGCVAERASAHDRDPGDLFCKIGRALHRQRHVRQGTDRDDPQSGERTGALRDEAGTVVARSDPRGSRDLDACKARVAVDVRRISGRARERPRSARVDGNVDARELRGDDRVAGRVLEGGVARDGGDADELAVPGRGEDREHVVVARIAIQEQSLSGHEVILLA